MLLRATLLIGLLGAASGLSPARFGAKAWQRRGVYAGRSDMPRVADVAAAVGAPAPWQVRLLDLRLLRVQPLTPMAAASITYGCSLHHLWLQPLSPMVAGAEVDVERRVEAA